MANLLKKLAKPEISAVASTKYIPLLIYIIL